MDAYVRGETADDEDWMWSSQALSRQPHGALSAQSSKHMARCTSTPAFVSIIICTETLVAYKMDLLDRPGCWNFYQMHDKVEWSCTGRGLGTAVSSAKLTRGDAARVSPPDGSRRPVAVATPLGESVVRLQATAANSRSTSPSTVR